MRLYYYLSDRINRIVRIFFVIINFRKKLMIPQSTFGEIKNLTVANIPLSEFLSNNCGHDIVIISYFAESDWVFFVSSGNKE